jgi:hypothetical protein
VFGPPPTSKPIEQHNTGGFFRPHCNTNTALDVFTQLHPSTRPPTHSDIQTHLGLPRYNRHETSQLEERPRQSLTHLSRPAERSTLPSKAHQPLSSRAPTHHTAPIAPGYFLSFKPSFPEEGFPRPSPAKDSIRAAAYLEFIQTRREFLTLASR